ncbi:MAG: nicotinate-nucleotide adenylyltransferase [Dehalococcoidia bacterium]|nr:nicotinate-nucleotide adenylyltransferase [Dehalococcoidia bacterium]
MKIGLLGGTFDPIHIGHLIVAEEVRVQLGLDKVLFIPARQSPLKQDRLSSPVEDRLAMVEMAVASNPFFEVSRIELERDSPSYTIETVRFLLKRSGPGTSIYFLVGLDQAMALPNWKDPLPLMEICRLVFLSRPGWPPLDFESLDRHIPRARERILSIEVPAIGISSTEIRKRVSRGVSIKYLVPEAVEEYIMSHGLYTVASIT